MSTRTTTSHLFGRAVAVVILAGGLTIWLYSSQSAPDRDDAVPGDSDEERVLVGDAAGRLPGETAEDWVVHADQVVVAKVIGEKEEPTSQEELERGEGLIFRTLEMSVDKVIWTYSQAPSLVPPNFQWSAFGWHFENGSTANRTKMAAAEAPRFEVGHTYILALDYVPACDSKSPGRWEGLSGDALLPFDAGVIGVGESEGVEVSLAEVKNNATSESQVLKNQMAGKSDAALAEALTNAEATLAPSERAKDACW